MLFLLNSVTGVDWVTCNPANLENQNKNYYYSKSSYVGCGSVRCPTEFEGKSITRNLTV